VNRLSRELHALRQANRDLESQLAQLKAQPASSASPAPQAPSSRRDGGDDDAAVAAVLPSLSNLMRGPMRGQGSQEPSVALMLDTMQRENEALRNRLVDTERDYVRVSRLNEVYREELIEHRSRVSCQAAL
jgi:hypothetical protein